MLGTLIAAASAAACPAQVPPPLVPPLPAPRSFVRTIDNPWFPLIPGTVYRYRGVKDGKHAIDVLKVTDDTRKIEGIAATVVRDRLYLSGHLEERTTDWYAQDRAGNVWYLGEATATLTAAGKVISREGSWRAGVNGACAGIYMPARPRVGEAGRQEYYLGHAEDQFTVLDLRAHASSPAASSRHALLTKETTRLEPGTLDHKLYVRGIGDVVERTVVGPTERLKLVSVSRP